MNYNDKIEMIAKKCAHTQNEQIRRARVWRIKEKWILIFYDK